MLREVDNGLVTYRFTSLPPDRLVHAVFGRLGGVSQGPFASLNVGHSVGDDDGAVNENHARIYAHLHLKAEQVVTARQVHGNRVVWVSAADAGRVLPATDGLITADAGLALMLRFADCQPVLLYDPARPALGLVHAGWRGIAQGIVCRAVEAMKRTFGTDPADMIACLGPAIGPCCYLVGDKVATAMGYALPNWHKVMSREGNGWRFDLPAANAQQLAAVGVQRIEHAGLCSACHSDEFFSHRAENGHTGRFAVVAYLMPFPEARNAGLAAGMDEGTSRSTSRTTGGGAERLARRTLPSSLQAPGLPALAEPLHADYDDA